MGPNGWRNERKSAQEQFNELRGTNDVESGLEDIGDEYDPPYSAAWIRSTPSNPEPPPLVITGISKRSITDAKETGEISNDHLE